MANRNNVREKRKSAGRLRRGGSLLVEAAIVLNVVLAIMLGTFDHCRALMLRELVGNAAREGARLAVANTDTLATSDIQTAVTNYLAGQPVANLSISVFKANPSSGANTGAWTDATLSDCIAVQVQGDYTPMLRGFSGLPNPVHFNVTAMMFSEAN